MTNRRRAEAPVWGIYQYPFDNHGTVVAGLIDNLRDSIPPIGGLSHFNGHAGLFVEHIVFRYSGHWSWRPGTRSRLNRRV